MKYLITIIAIVVFSFGTAAQVLPTVPLLTKTATYPFSISDNKTSSIVFPFDIISVDRGRREIIVQKAKGVNHILLLKASNKHFPETNLTVITADGQLYSFTIQYASNPDSLHLHISHNKSRDSTVQKHNSITTIQENLERISQKKERNTRLRASRHGITLDLFGLYVKGNTMYFQFSLRNCTYIDFNTASFSIAIADKKQRKRTARQVVPVTPVAYQGSTTSIAGKTTQHVVIAVPKFTIPDKKKCIIQLMEENGGRHITLKLPNSILVRARPVSTI